MKRLFFFAFGLALLALALPAPAQVTPTSMRAFTNFPTLIVAEAVSNATVTQYTYKSNAIPIAHGKGLGLAFRYAQATNADIATVTHYFGLIYNGTNTTTYTNFSWPITTKGVAYNTQRVYTNVPADILNNADYLFWFSTQNGATNTLTNTCLWGLQP